MKNFQSFRFVATLLVSLLAVSQAHAISTSGLRVWLQGDVGVTTDGLGNVSSWADQSGLGNNALWTSATNAPNQSLAAINGKNTVLFTSSATASLADRLTLPTTGTLGITNSDYEIFVVARPTTAASVNPFLFGTTAAERFEAHLTSAGSIGARFIPDALTYSDLGRTGAFINRPQPQIFSMRVEGDVGYTRANGVTTANASPSGARASDNVALRLGIRAGDALSYSGDMAEVLVYNRALSAAERYDVEKYLAQKWNGVYMEQEGGSMVQNNVAAASNGAVAFAQNVIGSAPHSIANLNDGLYGNNESWIGSTTLSYAGVAFAGSKTIDAIAFGRDNGGEATVHPDRDEGTYTLQYTRDANVLANHGNASIWTTIGEQSYGITTSAGQYPFNPSLRHLFSFNAIGGVTGVRIIVNSTDGTGAIAIDELEVQGLPEPSSALVLGLGALGLFVARRRRQK